MDLAAPFHARPDVFIFFKSINSESCSESYFWHQQQLGCISIRVFCALEWIPTFVNCLTKTGTGREPHLGRQLLGLDWACGDTLVTADVPWNWDTADRGVFMAGPQGTCICSWPRGCPGQGCLEQFQKGRGGWGMDSEGWRRKIRMITAPSGVEKGDKVGNCTLRCAGRQ